MSAGSWWSAWSGMPSDVLCLRGDLNPSFLRTSHLLASGWVWPQGSRRMRRKWCQIFDLCLLCKVVSNIIYTQSQKRQTFKLMCSSSGVDTHSVFSRSQSQEVTVHRRCSLTRLLSIVKLFVTLFKENPHCCWRGTCAKATTTTIGTLISCHVLRCLIECALHLKWSIIYLWTLLLAEWSCNISTKVTFYNIGTIPYIHPFIHPFTHSCTVSFNTS